MRGVTEPCARLEHAHPWCSEETHFGRELASLLAAKIKFVRQRVIEKHDGFTERQSVFTSAETEDIDAGLPRDFLWFDVERRDSVCETRAVHVQFETKLFYFGGNRFDFVRRV